MADSQLNFCYFSVVIEKRNHVLPCASSIIDKRKPKNALRTNKWPTSERGGPLQWSAIEEKKKMT